MTIPRRAWRFLSNEKQRELAIASVREEMLFWGHDLSEMTDDEVEAGCVRMAKAVARAGITTEQAIERFGAMARCAKEAD